MNPNIETSDSETAIRIRKVKRGDKPDILTIEQDSFENPWCQSDLDCIFGLQANCGCIVAEYDEQVIGFIVCKPQFGKVRILDIAVTDVFRRRGCGTDLVDKLIAQLCPDSLRSIVANVRETNDAAISFFAKLGFRGTKVLRQPYNDSPEDAYRLEWNLAGHREIVANGKGAGHE